jgi:acylphosphatase
VAKVEPPPNAKELRLIRIHGKVQGVGYRFFATRVARRLGLKGSIQNQRDGCVEAVVEGERRAIDQWIEELREGPRYAEVTQIDQETKEFTGRLGDFDVRF